METNNQFPSQLYNHKYIFDNVQFIEQIIECIEGKPRPKKKIRDHIVKVLREKQQSYKDKTKIKSGGKALSPLK